ncbi:acyltransferase [Pseudoalteromonas denitrificans]|uniref:1-acyl-sn-glycerol-3-phosphate acyltransferases n=1 Tax=Pseudoalteromonas denitrificans DSM 6059 TaxID=1123010 RepID=A0A1I1RZC3_9GAMM|nr:acyltransferase [Pseudoalteromonas denitrificans]SFD39679.1 1-acyl-sn-glycerol-3-phosphate acyltransferases [Pseudoalteromonas denitrificans DSM 6059]
MGSVLSKLKRIICIGFYAVNTLFWVLPIIVCGFLKLLPIKPWQKLISWLAKSLAGNWVACNSVIQNVLTPFKFEVTGLEELKAKDWYLVIANHQSWVDILVMQRLLHNRIPFLNFFLKKELIYVPFLGLAWWALDFPFMSRTSKAQLRKKPSLRGKDIETTRKACEKFKEVPVSIVNFVEGTRFTKNKHERQNSPFQNLLKPKAGGVAFVLEAMGDQLSKIVNITIHYPDGIPTFVDFASGQVKRIQVHVEVMPINDALVGNYSQDTEFRVKFQSELNKLWQDKEQNLKILADKESA